MRGLTLIVALHARYVGDRNWARHTRDGRESDAGFDEGHALHHRYKLAINLGEVICIFQFVSSDASATL